MTPSGLSSIPRVSSDHYRPSMIRQIDHYAGAAFPKSDYWRPSDTTPVLSAEVNKTDADSQVRSRGEKVSSKTKVKRTKTSSNTGKSNPNKEPLGRRQMSGILNIIRAEGRDFNRSSMTLDGRSEEPKPGSLVPVRLDVAASIAAKPYHFLPVIPEPLFTSTISYSEHVERPRTNLSNMTFPHSEIRTSLIAPPTIEERLEPHPPMVTDPNFHEKLDFGNRVDQCLLKMDKWADAWLSSALMTEDKTGDPDNAWESFEYCLCMPDVLEEGEIIEYEEVPRFELPVATITCRTSLDSATTTKVKTPSFEASAIPQNLTQSEVVRERRLKTRLNMQAESLSERQDSPTSRGLKRQRDANIISSSTSTASSPWTAFRQTGTAALRSPSSPECKRARVTHIPSAATLRAEARMRQMM